MQLFFILPMGFKFMAFQCYTKGHSRATRNVMHIGMELGKIDIEISQWKYFLHLTSLVCCYVVQEGPLRSSLINGHLSLSQILVCNTCILFFLTEVYASAS